MGRDNVYLMWYHFESVQDLSKFVEDDATILDLGCGEGHLTSIIPDNYRVIAQDLALDSFKDPQSVTANRVRGDAIFLPYRDHSIDAILCHQVIEHVPRQEAMLRELLRIATFGGIVAISTPVSALLGRLLSPRTNHVGKKVLSPDHVREFSSLEELIDEMTRIGGEQVKIVKALKRWVQFPARRFPVLSRLKREVLIPLPLYYFDIYVVCKTRSVTAS
jgi:ubiquinone/menaquinone biosynthesis C-methylase UbiE